MAKILLLIIEDELGLAEMYAGNFKNQGFDVDIAHDGREGFDKMLTEHPSAVLMDIMMPGLSGLETLEKAKAEPSTKNIPIIMLTNLSSSAIEVQNAMNEGAAGYIVKAEATPSQVVEKVKKILNPPPPPTEPTDSSVDT